MNSPEYQAAEKEIQRQLTTGLNYINLSNMNLTVCPPIPEGTKIFTINTNPKLQALPNLPNSLLELNCSRNNSLSTLPELPNSLQKLSCVENKLTSLPSLPPQLQFLNCSDNQIKIIPILPNYLETCFFNNNPLVEPYATFYKNYRIQHKNIQQFINDVNNYYKDIQNKGKEALKFKQVSKAGLTEELGLSNNTAGVVSSFLTGKKGNISRQLANLKANYRVNLGPTKILEEEKRQKEKEALEKEKARLKAQKEFEATLFPPEKKKGGKRKSRKYKKSKKLKRTRKH